MNQFAEYIQHGWSLCRIEPSTKGPRSAGWNLRENAVTDASTLQAAGLMHAYSKTCALDIDRYDDAKKWLSECGIDLDALMNAPDAVQIVSGRENRGKLLYGLSTPLSSKSFAEGAFELRCGTSTGRTAQDVLPPSLHPSGGNYSWYGDWTRLSPLPESLLRVWQTSHDAVSKDLDRAESDRLSESTNIPTLRELVYRQDTLSDYDKWLSIGMAVHHETGGSQAGFELWSNWSKTSPKFKPGDEEAHYYKWRSFGRSANPITVDSLRRMDKATASDFEDVTSLLDDPPKPAIPELRFLPLHELFARPEPDWIIPGILPEAALGVMYGQWGSGKTFLETDMALSIALGQSWRGETVKQGKVLIVAAEDNRGVQIRLQAGLAARGAADAPVRVLPSAPNLTDPAKQKTLLEAIKRETGTSLIFFDTLTKVIAGADENSGQDMGKVLEYCGRIYDATGVMVILVHHESTKSPGRGMRGWSGLPDACDVIWELSKDELQHQLRIEKVKNAKDGGVYPFRLQPMANSRIVEWL